MLVSEILRIKGSMLYTTSPDAPVLDAVRRWPNTTSARWW